MKLKTKITPKVDSLKKKKKFNKIDKPLARLTHKKGRRPKTPTPGMKQRRALQLLKD